MLIEARGLQARSNLKKWFSDFFYQNYIGKLVKNSNLETDPLVFGMLSQRLPAQGQSEPHKENLSKKQNF